MAMGHWVRDEEHLAPHFESESCHLPQRFPLESPLNESKNTCHTFNTHKVLFNENSASYGMTTNKQQYLTLTQMFKLDMEHHSSWNG